MDREAALQVFRATFHDPADADLCIDCAEAVSDAAGVEDAIGDG